MQKTAGLTQTECMAGLAPSVRCRSLCAAQPIGTGCGGSVSMLANGLCRAFGRRHYVPVCHLHLGMMFEQTAVRLHAHIILKPYSSISLLVLSYAATLPQ